MTDNNLISSSYEKLFIENTHLTSELEIYKKDNAFLQNQLNITKSQLSESTAKTLKLLSTLNTYQSELKSKTTQLELLTKQSTPLYNTPVLNINDKTLNESFYKLKADNLALNKQVIELEIRNKHLNEMIIKLTQENKTYSENINKKVIYEKENACLVETSINVLEGKISKIEIENNNLRHNEKEYKIEIDKLNKELTLLKQKYTKKKEKCEELKKDINELKSKYELLNIEKINITNQNELQNKKQELIGNHKQKVFNELQHRITLYRNQLMQNRKNEALVNYDTSKEIPSFDSN